MDDVVAYLKRADVTNGSCTVNKGITSPCLKEIVVTTVQQLLSSAKHKRITQAKIMHKHIHALVITLESTK